MKIRELLQSLRTQKLATTSLDLVSAAGAAGVTVQFGVGTPEAAVTANMGSLFLRTDGGATTTLYVKTSGSGNTGWTAK
jgi:hypothetical protein